MSTLSLSSLELGCAAKCLMFWDPDPAAALVLMPANVGGRDSAFFSANTGAQAAVRECWDSAGHQGQFPHAGVHH